MNRVQNDKDHAMEKDLRDRVLERLKHSVQLLASSADQQLKLLPPYVCVADELALEFDHWREVTVHNYGSSLNSDQVSALAALDQTFGELTSLGQKELWTDEAIRTFPEWQNVRSLARRALAVFSWPTEAPPSHADEYVSQDRVRLRNEN